MILVLLMILVVSSCKIQDPSVAAPSSLPRQFQFRTDSTSLAQSVWRDYFGDEHLVALIDTALGNNQELKIATQEIEIARNEVKARTGEYLPFVGVRAGASVEKEGRYTRFGALEDNVQVKEGRAFPDPLTDYEVGLFASWEVDIWKKLRNAKKSAALRYLSSQEGRNFAVTNLIAEISNTYYELVALDNLLTIVQQNISIQENALDIVKQQKNAGKVTQLAVNRFEAQLLNTRTRQFDIQQRIVVAENRIRFLTGSYLPEVKRNPLRLAMLATDSAFVGVPAQLLTRRPDIRQAELELASANIDVKVARANFYPSLRIDGGIGTHTYSLSYLTSPASAMYAIAGGLMAPLVNRNYIKAAFRSANARQTQALVNYEQTILNAVLEVNNELASVANANSSFVTKSNEVDLLVQSVTISNSLFNSARADYLEVLLTQREALESKMELVDIRLQQAQAKVNIYRALGGGWNGN